jgi:lipopolysaccharide transport system permease protein
LAKVHDLLGSQSAALPDIGSHSPDRGREPLPGAYRRHRTPGHARAASLEYLEGIWLARHFWIHLALSDLRGRWRRSYLGPLWSIIQPLGMTILLAVVLGRIFHSPIRNYAPYILSGMVVWEFLVGTATGGSVAFLQADAYIRQCRHPLAIYTLRTALCNLIVLLLASLGLLGWTLTTMPGNFGWCWLAAAAIYPVSAAIAWPLATILAYAGARFRDIPHALALVFQALWFISPVYFEDRVFRAGNLDALVDYNPIYHLLQLARAPLLSGHWPTAVDFLSCGATFLVLALLAWAVGRRAERRVIFYL